MKLVITPKERFEAFAKDGGSSEKDKIDLVAKVWALVGRPGLNWSYTTYELHDIEYLL